MAEVKAVNWEQSNKAGYDKLLDQSARHSVQQRSGWLDAYVVEYLDQGPTLVLEVWDQGEMIGSLPLQIEEVRGTKFWNNRIYRGLGYGPADFFYIPALEERSEEVGISLAKWFAENQNEWEELRLNFIPEDCKVAPYFVTALRSCNLITNTDSTRQYYVLDTSGSWENYYTPEFNKKIRDIRGRLNRVQRNDITLTYEEVKGNIIEYLPGFIHHFNLRRQEKDEKSSFEDDRKIRLIKSILPEYEKKGWINLSLLKDNHDNIWAYQLDLIHNNTWYHYSPAFDKEYSWYSPSKLLLYHTLQKCFERDDIHQLNFMRGESNYKTQFTEVTGNYLHLTAGNPGSVRKKAQKAASKLVAIKNKFLK